MKYVMLETAEGQKLPFLFPEAINHIDMYAAMSYIIMKRMHRAATPISAGFVSFDDPLSVHGASESLGGLEHNPVDAFRIVAGESVAFMSDEMLVPLMDKIRGAIDRAPTHMLH